MFRSKLQKGFFYGLVSLGITWLVLLVVGALYTYIKY